MVEDTSNFEGWMYEISWKLRDEALDGIKIIDAKAMSIVNFSSILIPIITATLYYISNIKTYSEIIQLFLVISIILLIVSIFLAFKVLMPQNHGIIRIQNHFKKIDESIDKIKDKDEFSVARGVTAQEIAEWQNVLISAIKKKSRNFKYSSWVFVGALVFVFLSTMGISYPWIKQALVLLVRT